MQLARHLGWPPLPPGEGWGEGKTAMKKATTEGRLFHVRQILLAVDLIKDPAIIEVGLLH